VPRRTRKSKNLPGLSVEIKGAGTKHLQDQREKFRLHYNKLIWEQAIVPTADRVEQLAKSYAPSDTGFLRSTIQQKEVLRKTSAFIKVRPNYREYDDYFYAPVQEFGSRKRNIRAVKYMDRARKAVRGLFAKLMEKASNRAIATYQPIPSEEAA
jgi:hypothetical protein